MRAAHVDHARSLNLTHPLEFARMCMRMPDVRFRVRSLSGGHDFRRFCRRWTLRVGPGRHVRDSRHARFKGDVPTHVLASTSRAHCSVFPARGTPWIFMFHPEARWLGTYELSSCGVVSHPVVDLTASQLASLGAGTPPRIPRAFFVAAMAVVLACVAAIVRFGKRREQSK